MCVGRRCLASCRKDSHSDVTPKSYSSSYYEVQGNTCHYSLRYAAYTGGSLQIRKEKSVWNSAFFYTGCQLLIFKKKFFLKGFSIFEKKKVLS